MRVVFMGTPEFSAPVLAEIIGQGHDVAAVYSRAPKPAGRGMELRKTPVHDLAERFSIPVLTPKTLRTAEAAETFRAHNADVAVVVAYGLILPREILDAPAQGCLNLHASLLPRWRGAAPIQRAIMAGDAQSGVIAMRMEEGLDTGPIGMAERVAIAPDMTAGDLHDVLSRIGADLMARALAALSRGSLSFTPQSEEGAIYARKIDKAEARIDWNKPAREVHNHIRGLSPFPGAWFEADFGHGPERVKALRSHVVEGGGSRSNLSIHPGALLDETLTVACGTGALRLIELQRAGKSAMRAEDFLHGSKLAAQRFS